MRRKIPATTKTLLFFGTRKLAYDDVERVLDSVPSLLVLFSCCSSTGQTTSTIPTGTDLLLLQTNYR